MRIAMVAPLCSPLGGGVGKIVDEYASSLAEDFGHDVTVFTHEGDIPAEASSHKVRVLSFPTITIKSPYTISCKMFGALLKGKFDVIHSHHYGYAPATVGFAAAKMKRTKHVFSTYYHPPFYSRHQWALFSSYHITQGFPILKFSDTVITMTRFEEKMIKRLGASNTKVLPGFVDTDVFRPVAKKREKTVLFVSRLTEQKGADVVMDLADKMTKERSDVRFVFVGSLQNEQSILRRYINLRKNKSVKFLENVQEEKLAGLFSAATVSVLPSKYEAFGLVLAESQACETPVVATRVGGTTDAVDDKKTGFLVGYGDWDELERKIRTLIDDDKLNKRMGKAGRRYVAENLDKRKVIKKLSQIYGEIA